LSQSWHEKALKKYNGKDEDHWGEVYSSKLDGKDASDPVKKRVSDAIDEANYGVIRVGIYPGEDDPYDEYPHVYLEYKGNDGGNGI
jgi:hypothetical protein